MTKSFQSWTSSGGAVQTEIPFVVPHVLLSATAQPGVPAASVIATFAVFVDVSTRPFFCAAATYASNRVKSKTPFCCSIRCQAKSPCAIVPIGTAGTSFALTMETPKNSGGIGVAVCALEEAGEAKCAIRTPRIKVVLRK